MAERENLQLGLEAEPTLRTAAETGAAPPMCVLSVGLRGRGQRGI